MSRHRATWPAPFKPGRILLVDDDNLVAVNTRALLDQAGYYCDRARSLRQARALLAGRCHNLVLLDHNLPDGTGADLLHPLADQAPETAVIYLTAMPPAHLEHVRRCPLVREVLMKPVDRAELIQTIQRHAPRTCPAGAPSIITRQERLDLLALLPATG